MALMHYTGRTALQFPGFECPTVSGVPGIIMPAKPCGGPNLEECSSKTCCRPGMPLAMSEVLCSGPGIRRPAYPRPSICAAGPSGDELCALCPQANDCVTWKCGVDTAYQCIPDPKDCDDGNACTVC
jgi:hypothetical protein